MTTQEQAEQLAMKLCEVTPCGIMTDAERTRVILSTIPLVELLEVARAAQKYKQAYHEWQSNQKLSEALTRDIKRERMEHALSTLRSKGIEL